MRTPEVKWATRGLLRAAPDSPQERHRDAVAYWDARTSANDWRASLSIALGAPVAAIDPVLGTHRVADRIAAPVSLQLALGYENEPSDEGVVKEFTRTARAALLAAVPYIEAGLREQISDEILATLVVGGTGLQVYTNGAIKRAARVARGTQEATK